MAGRIGLVVVILAAVFSLTCGNLYGRSSAGKTTRQFVKRRDPSPSFRPHLALRQKLAEAKPFSYPAAELGARTARSADADERNCGLKKPDLLETDAMPLSETAETIQAVWVEDDNILIVASDSDRATVWLGVPKSYGIFSFSPHPNLIPGAVAPSSLQVAPASHRRAIVVSKDKKAMFVTSNGGKTWVKVLLPSSGFDVTDDLYISEVSPDHMILAAGTELFHSHSAGEEWERVADDVLLVRMAKNDSRNEYAFFLTLGRHPGLNTLHRLSIPWGKRDVLDPHAYRFAVDGRYLFVSRQNFSGSAMSDNVSRRLYVCSDFGADVSEIAFSEVQLPSVTPEQFYVIMATHEAGAFIHVSLNQSSGSGGLYVSDSSATRFSLSLSNHFYKVFSLKEIEWRYPVDDFYEVKSMRGVYVTTAVTGKNDSTHVTMITFNNGGKWSRLHPPTSSGCHGNSECSLHLHLHYSLLVASEYNRSYSAPLLSTETAVGIIIGHGSYGVTRNDSEPRLVVSNDGGYSWMDPGLPVGTYVYGIADYGNIIVVAPDSENVEYIWFSHNRGECFVKQLLDTTEFFSLSRGLLMDPRASSLTAFMMGVEGNETGDEWRMITLNFKRLLQRKCVPSDYQKWVEHVNKDACPLGYRDTYNITKSLSICYNEQGYKYKPILNERCDCSTEDLECDYGYNRTKDDTCERMKGYNLADDCPPGAKYFNRTKSGFRLIPGDRCLPSSVSRQLLKTEQLPCVGHEEEAGFDNAREAIRRAGVTAGRVVGGVIIALIVVAFAVVAFYCFLRCREHSPAT
ncbi:Sortilin [Geodia barretti]|nr:Sortilin [Geodia barretti]